MSVEGERLRLFVVRQVNGGRLFVRGGVEHFDRPLIDGDIVLTASDGLQTLSDDEITAIREGQLEAFAPAELALLRMADAMADTPSNVNDELYRELRRHFSEEQLIELTATAALENFRARYNRVFDVGSDGLYRKGLRFKQR